MPRIVIRDRDVERIIALGDDEVVLGRGSEATVRLRASGVSKRHAAIRRSERGYEVLDLESHNGVLVNGARVQTHFLRAGDRIALGEAEVAFQDEAAPLLAAPAATSPIGAASGETCAAAAAATPDGLPSAPTGLPSDSAGAPPPRAHALLRAAQRILEADLDVSRLLSLVMDILIVETGAARGFVVLALPDGRLESCAARNLEGRDLSSPGLQLSGSIVREVLRTGEPVLLADAAEDIRFLGRESVGLLGLHSVLAVPILAGGSVLGAIYLDDPRSAGRFSPEDRDLACGVAALASRPIANARLHALTDAELRRTALELVAAREEMAARCRLGNLVARSAAMREVFARLRRAAATTVPLVLAGESGTGKELAARAVHVEGSRARGPFVVANAASVSEELLESELFGHVRGAFTGAEEPRDGLFRLAHRGTIVLDGIEEMSPALQAKLLRVLQDGLVRPVGADVPVPTDVRIVATTIEDPLELVRAGLLRDDLYYRLAVLVVRIPPLRERLEDVPLLVEHLLAREGGRTIEPDAVGPLVAHSWPGNVRELEGLLRELALFAAPGPITRALVQDRLARERHSWEGAPDDLAGLSLPEAKERFERRVVAAALARAGGNIAAAARELKVDRAHLHRVARRLRVDPIAYREEAPPPREMGGAE